MNVSSRSKHQLRAIQIFCTLIIHDFRAFFCVYL